MARTDLETTYGGRVRPRVCGLCFRQGKLLLLRHEGLGPRGYLWAVPGGGCEPGEAAPQALEREFAEETGLQVRTGAFLFVSEYIAPPLHALELYFQVEIAGGELQLGSDPEVPEGQQILSEAGFFSWEGIQALPPESLQHFLTQFPGFEAIKAARGAYLAKKEGPAH